MTTKQLILRMKFWYWSSIIYYGIIVICCYRALGIFGVMLSLWFWVCYNRYHRRSEDAFLSKYNHAPRGDMSDDTNDG